MRRFSKVSKVLALTVALVPSAAMLGAALEFEAVAMAANPPAGEAPHGEHGGDHGGAEHGGGHGAMPISSPEFWLDTPWTYPETDGTGMLWIIINFGILAFAVEKLLLVNLRKGHAEKRQAIVEQLEKATAARKEAEAIIAEYRTKVDELDDEVSSVLAKADERAQSEFDRIVDEAKVEADKILAQAKAQAEREGAMRIAKIEAEVVDQALAAAEAALRKQFGAAEQRKSVDDYVAEIADADLGKAS